MRQNPILKTDSYKFSHFKQYPENTVRISSYIESRGGTDEVVFFGLQAFVKEYLLDPITLQDINEAEELVTAHGFEFNREGWMRILELHDGYLPLKIEAMPEGLVAAPGNVQVQVINTDAELPWLTSYIETALLRAIWYPSTIATKSRDIKKIIKAGLEKTSDDPEGQLPFKLHDFGARGVDSGETAMLGGMAHLINFMGTDTMEAIVGARRYYDEPMAGFSIPASEHSTITSWGREGEVEAYRNMVNQFAGDGKLYACVSDSYDIWNAVENIWGDELKELVETSGGTLVVRPDSGDPVETPVKVIELLMEKFGHTTNSKGYKVLPACVRVIQGDGIGKDDVQAIIDLMISKKLSVDNIAFGMGGGLLGSSKRDDFKYAMKANARQASNGTWHDVYKDPIAGGKTSKKGRQALALDVDGNWVTRRRDEVAREDNHLVLVYMNGEMINECSFADIRERAKL